MIHSIRLQRSLNRVTVYVLLGCYLVVLLFPFYWMIVTSLKSTQEIYQTTRMLTVQRPSLAAYHKLLFQTSFLRYFANSTIVTLSAIGISLLVSAMGAYSITKLRWFGRGILGTVILFTYLIPASALMIPMYLVLRDWHLINSLQGLILIYPTFVLPFCTWMLMGYFQSIPTELIEASRVDGVSHFGALVRIVAPLAAPGLATAAIFGFVLSWTLYEYPLVLITDDWNQLLPVGVRNLALGDVYPWAMLMGAGLMAAVPPVLFFLLAQKYVVQGLTAGSIK